MNLFCPDPFAGPDGESAPEKFHDELELALAAAVEVVVGRQASPAQIKEFATRTKYNNGWVVYRWQDADLLYVEAKWAGDKGHRTMTWGFVQP